MTRKVFLILLALVLTLSVGLVACIPAEEEEEEEETPPFVPSQLPGEHSVLSTYDGSIRDDDLVKYICDQIPKNAEGVPQVKDVTIMFNSCYGGGMLDDFQRAFGPEGACKDVPWVFGAASAANETAVGYGNADVNHYDAGRNLGSTWTQALAGPCTSHNDSSPGAIRHRTSDNVRKDLEAARDKDYGGPNGTNNETPVVSWGNGGEKIQWGSSKEPAAVLFSGNSSDLRHNNNIENMDEALRIVWNDFDTTRIKHTWGDEFTGTIDQLKLWIDVACSYLNSDTQLVLYFDDHGGTSFDLDEFLKWLLPQSIYDLISIGFDLHAGWEEGLTAMYQQPGDEPSPFLSLSLVDPIFGEEWGIALNEIEIPLPSGELTGELQLPVDWTSIQTGTNQLEIFPLDDPSGPMVLNNLELCSGPINEVENDISIGEEAVTFADPNLEAAIREAIDIPEGPIYPSDLEDLTLLNASEMDIADLTGLEHCTDLTELYLGRNQIDDISPLADLTGLTRLSLHHNQISDISPLANLTSLTYLSSGWNQIEDISPLANLTSLTWLYLRSNNITDVGPLVENEGLSEGDEVALNGNPLSDTSINTYIPQLEARGVNVDY